MRELFCRWLAVGALCYAGCASEDKDDSPEDEFEPPVADGCIDDVSPGVQTFMCDELSFQVTIPDECVEAPCGLILDVHGWFMTGEQEAAESEIDVLGIEHGYIAVHPTATLAPGRLSSEPEPSWRQGEDDIALHAFLEHAIEVLRIDPKRVHLMGFSQGGGMTWRMLCDYPEMFASVSPGAAATGYGLPSSGGICEGGGMPDEQVPVMFLHGTNDALSPFGVAASQHDALIAGWEMREVEVLSEDDSHVWTRYENDEGNVYEFLEHDYESPFDFLKGHCFPGSPVGSIFSCKGDAAFAWGPVAIEFFKQHPKP